MNNTLGRQPLVSVILASYNHEEFISEAIKSVLHQSMNDLELIIVDDGSIDRTYEIAKNFKDKRISLHKLDENRRYNPRNYGISLARGKYVAFQNSDDMWEWSKLGKQLDAFRNNPSTAVVFTGVEIIDERSKHIEGTWADGLFAVANKPRLEWLRFFLDTGNCHCISSSMVPLETLIKAGGFSDSLFQLSDFDLWVKLAGLGEIHIINEKLTKMRILETKNYSYPTESNQNRSAVETWEVLDHYFAQPIFGQLEKILPDVYADSPDDDLLRIGYLLRYMWHKNIPNYTLFAVNKMTELLQKEGTREKLCRHFGVGIIHEYIEKKGNVKIINQN